MTAVQYRPVAGCAPCTHRQAGDYHHRWLVVDENNHWLTTEAAAALSRVTTDLKMGYLVLRAPGMLRMDIPLDVIEDDDSVVRQATVVGQNFAVVDEGDLAAVWFGHVTGKTCRLVKVHPDAAPIQWPAD